MSDEPFVLPPDLQEAFEQEVFAIHRDHVMAIFGVDQADMDLLDNLERDSGYLAAKAQVEAERAGWLAWAKDVTERLSEPMDPHVDRLKILEYLNGKVEWEALNSPEQAQIMDWRLR